jgi:hypothetical protein
MYLFFAGFRSSYRPPAPPNHGLKDIRPDVHDEADFDIPYTQAVLERFMFLSMDSDEVSTATVSPTTQCASCWCPSEQVHDSDHVFPFRDTQEIRAELETERAQLLNQDGAARDRCKDRVSF